jgi:type II secretory pathway pseudopilin PulG
MRRIQTGLSILEFTLVVLVISVLGAVLLSRITQLRVQVERAAIQQTLNQMRSALAVRFAELHIQGDEAAIREWAGGNALALLREDIGTRDIVTGEPDDLAGAGEWSFQDGTVTYRPLFPEALAGDPDAVGRWEVVLRGSPEEPRGFALRAVDPLIEDRGTTNEGG